MVKIKILDNGPYIVEGEVEIYDGADKLMNNKSQKQSALCRCGLSEKMPYCDGAHVGKLESVVRG